MVRSANEDERLVVASTRLPESMFERFRDACEADHRSISQQLRKLASEWLDEVAPVTDEKAAA